MTDVLPVVPSPADVDLWPQAAGELLGLAYHFRKRGMDITAAQIRLAVELANQGYEKAKQQRQ